MPDPIHTVLGFDFGSRWIGVAVGQTCTETASPLAAVRVINHRPDWNHIGRLIKDWQPQQLIVGHPLKMNDEATDMTQPAQRFARQLQGRFSVPTELIDERLTTREAWQILEQGSSRKQSKAELDSIAAVLITETWLHQHQAGANNYAGPG